VVAGLVFLMTEPDKWSAYARSNGELIRSHVLELDGFSALKNMDGVLIAIRSGRGDVPALVKGFRILP